MRKEKTKSSESKSVGADTTIPKQRKKCSEGGCGSSIRSLDHLFTLPDGHHLLHFISHAKCAATTSTTPTWEHLLAGEWKVR